MLARAEERTSRRARGVGAASPSTPAPVVVVVVLEVMGLLVAGDKVTLGVAVTVAAVVTTVVVTGAWAMKSTVVFRHP